MGCGASATAGAKGYDPSGPIGLDHFKQERVLGEGGFGKVRFVIKRDTQKGYAMKCMDKHTIVEKKHEIMVFKERALLVDLSTPESGGQACRFITNLHFAFHDANQVYLVMDLALGGTLKYHLKKHAKGYPTAHAQFYCAQIYDGLAFLHAPRVETASPDPASRELGPRAGPTCSVEPGRRGGPAEPGVRGDVGSREPTPPPSDAQALQVHPLQRL